MTDNPKDDNSKDAIDPARGAATPVPAGGKPAERPRPAGRPESDKEGEQFPRDHTPTDDAGQDDSVAESVGKAITEPFKSD